MFINTISNLNKFKIQNTTTMESVNREDIIVGPGGLRVNNDIVNNHPIVASNICQICYKSFSLKRALKQHRHIHEESLRFPCLLCKNTFSAAGSLKRHKLVHTGEKPHQCTSCPKTFP